MRLDSEVSYDEMTPNIEGRTRGIFLVGATSLTLLTIFIFIYIKKLRGPTRQRLSTKRNNIHCEDMESQETESSVTFKDSIGFHSSGFEKDAAGHNNLYENEITFDNSAALHLKYTTEVEGFFNSAGGVLNAAPNSDVQIIIENGAIPDGDFRRFFFKVIFDETALLHDIPDEMTLISPVIECGPHDINLLKPVEIIIPHCLYLKEIKKKWISVYRTDSGSLNWEKIPSESEKTDQSKAWFIARPDSIHIKTMTFSLWSILACGGPKKKRATVFSSKPDRASDLIYLRFYVYNDNEDSRKRVEMKDEQRFSESKRSREQPFKLYNGNKRLTVRLTDIEEGWELDKTDAEQIYHCDKANGRGFRAVYALDFAVKPIEGRKVKGFSSKITFRQEGDEVVNDIYVNPGFTPLERLEPVNSPRQNFTGSSVPEVTTGISTFTAPEEMRRDFGKRTKPRTGLKKSQSLNVPRQRHATNCGLEAISHTCRSSNSTAGCSTSSASEESVNGSLDKISKTPKDSKLLCSLLDNRPILKKVCTSLNAEKPGLGDYRNVCSHYEIDRDTVTTDFKDHEAGPSGALFEYLAAKYPRLTIAEFVGVLRETTKREDVPLLLEEHDNQ